MNEPWLLLMRLVWLLRMMLLLLLRLLLSRPLCLSLLLILLLLRLRGPSQLQLLLILLLLLLVLLQLTLQLLLLLRSIDELRRGKAGPPALRIGRIIQVRCTLDFVSLYPRLGIHILELL